MWQLKVFIVKLRFKTYGPMNYFPLRAIIEERIAVSRIHRGVITLHARGATPALLITKEEDLRFVDEALKKLIPVVGWAHGNAYAHLRSTIASTVKTLIIDGGKLALPKGYEVYFLETRPVYNHEREMHMYIRGLG